MSQAEPRRIGPLLATLLVAGNMIGSGLYLLPASLADVGSSSLLAWIAAAAGALAIAAIAVIGALIGLLVPAIPFVLLGLLIWSLARRSPKVPPIPT